MARAISRDFQKPQEILKRKENIVIKETVRTSELNSFASIRACRPWRVIRAQTWLAGILILLSFPSAFAQGDFSAFWKKFKSAVIAGDKAAVAEMTKFPLSMGYEMEVVKNKENFSRRYNEIFKGDATLLNALEALNLKKNRRGGIMSIALLRRLQTTRKTHRYASFLS